MVELRLLGSVHLQASDGRDVEALVRHAKRTALLAYLAAALPRGPHRRDTLLAMFWPEFDSARARAALSQALYVVREALGSEAIVPLGDGALAVDGAAVWCDVVAFEAALDAGRPREALELYRGDLLEGFFVTGAPEFERWLERERARLRERASEGAWALADERATAGDTLEAERWARRAADLLPADEAVARRLVAFLHRLGDRAAAIRAYEEFTARLAQEYELEPSAETQALAAAIRAEEVRPPTSQPAVRVVSGGEVPAPAGAAPADPSLPPRRFLPVAGKRAAAVVALVGVALLAGGWFLVHAALGARTAVDARTPKRLVVLPFANLGPAEEEYFTDGITEEITTRLASVERLRVIGRTSANAYKDTKKTLQQIGAELGVDYVVEGAIRWEKSPQGPARVRITPQLVNTADGTHLWAEVYDEPLDDIFRVQADIAQRVVHALDVNLLERQRRVVEASPTGNLRAYDAYLRGNDYMRRGTDESAMRAAQRMYEQAVELDPRFALAYARLSRVHSRIYLSYVDRSPDRLAQAKRAVDNAFKLEPDLPEAHHSLATYYWIGYSDYDRALREYAIAEVGRPNDSEIFEARANLRQRQGTFRDALADFEKAWQLDPASPGIASTYALTCELVRDYPHAEALYDRAIALAPDRPIFYFMKTHLYLRWDGSTQKARAVLDEARTAGVRSERLVLGGVWVDMFDRRFGETITRLSTTAPEVFEDPNRFIPRSQLYAEVYGLMQRHDLERAYYDSARSLVAGQVRERPDDPRLHSALGIAYAGLGRRREAIEEGQKAVQLLPISKEALRGYHRAVDLARIYAMVGERDAAVERLEYLLSIPGPLSAAWLRVDPTWDPLRSDPRFQRLLDRER